MSVIKEILELSNNNSRLELELAEERLKIKNIEEFKHENDLLTKEIEMLKDIDGTRADVLESKYKELSKPLSKLNLKKHFEEYLVTTSIVVEKDLYSGITNSTSSYYVEYRKYKDEDLGKIKSVGVNNIGLWQQFEKLLMLKRPAVEVKPSYTKEQAEARYEELKKKESK